MAKITRILATNICRQFSFVITTTANTHCLVQNVTLICYWQLVNATSQYNDSRSSRYSKWLNDRMVAVVTPCTRKKSLQRKVSKKCYWKGVKKILACSVSRQVIVIASFTCLCLKGQLGLFSLRCNDRKLFCELASTC